MFSSVILFACFIAAQISYAEGADDVATKCIDIPRPSPSLIIYNPIYASTEGTSVYGLQVNKLPNTAAHLAESPFEGTVEYESSSAGGYLRVNPWAACTPNLYLTIDELYPGSTKPIVWTEALHTKYWVVQAGQNITTSATSPFGVKSTFLACGANRQLYLQTGNDISLEVKCVQTKLTPSFYR